MGRAFNRLRAAFNQFEVGVKIGVLALTGGVFAVGALFGGLVGQGFGQLNIFAGVG